MAGNDPNATELIIAKKSVGGAIAESGEPSGSSGQILTKFSNLPGDYGWQTPVAYVDPTLRYSPLTDTPDTDILRKYHPMDIKSISVQVTEKLMADTVAAMMAEIAAIPQVYIEPDPIDLTVYLKNNVENAANQLIIFKGGLRTDSIDPITTDGTILWNGNLQFSGLNRSIAGAVYIGTGGRWATGGHVSSLGYITISGGNSADASAAILTANVKSIMPRAISRTDTAYQSFRTTLGTSTLPFKGVYTDELEINGKQLIDATSKLINATLLPPPPVVPAPVFASGTEVKLGTNFTVGMSPGSLSGAIVPLTAGSAATFKTIQYPTAVKGSCIILAGFKIAYVNVHFLVDVTITHHVLDVIFPPEIGAFAPGYSVVVTPVTQGAGTARQTEITEVLPNRTSTSITLNFLAEGSLYEWCSGVSIQLMGKSA